MKVALVLLCSLLAGSHGCSLDDIDPCITWDANAGKDANLGKARVNAGNTEARWERLEGQTHDGIVEDSTPQAIVNLANCKRACEGKAMVAYSTVPVIFNKPANYDCTSIARHKNPQLDEAASTTCYMSSDIKLTSATTANPNVNYYEWQMWRSRQQFTVSMASATRDLHQRVSDKEECRRLCRDRKNSAGKGGCTQILYYPDESNLSFVNGPACDLWLPAQTLEAQPEAGRLETRNDYYPTYEDRILFVAIKGLHVRELGAQAFISSSDAANAGACKRVCWENSACRFVQFNARINQCLAYKLPLRALSAGKFAANRDLTVYEKISPSVV